MYFCVCVTVSPDKKVRYSCRSGCCLFWLLFLAYAIFVIVMVIELMKLSKCSDNDHVPACFTMERFELMNLTTAEVPFEVEAQLDLPVSSSVKIDVGAIYATVRDTSGQIVATSKDLQPLFDGQPTIRGGRTKLLTDAVISITGSGAEAALAALLSEILNFRDTKVEVEANIPIETGIFLFPLSYTYHYESPFACGYAYSNLGGVTWEVYRQTHIAVLKEEESKKCAEEWSWEDKQDSGCSFYCQMGDFPIVFPSDTLVANEERLDRDTVELNSLELWGDDMLMRMNATVDMGDMPLVLHVPRLGIDAFYSTSSIDPFSALSPHLLEERVAKVEAGPLVARDAFELEADLVVCGPGSGTNGSMCPPAGAPQVAHLQYF